MGGKIPKGEGRPHRQAISKVVYGVAHNDHETGAGHGAAAPGVAALLQAGACLHPGQGVVAVPVQGVQASRSLTAPCTHTTVLCILARLEAKG